MFTVANGWMVGQTGMLQGTDDTNPRSTTTLGTESERHICDGPGNRRALPTQLNYACLRGADLRNHAEPANQPVWLPDVFTYRLIRMCLDRFGGNHSATLRELLTTIYPFAPDLAVNISFSRISFRPPCLLSREVPRKGGLGCTGMQPGGLPAKQQSL